MILTCINCPRGCTLTVTKENDQITVTGNSCPRGEAFGKQEMIRPMRTLCTTCATVYADVPVVPCRTDGEIPKDRISAVMDEINRMCIDHPLGRGDVLIENVDSLGVNIIVTSNILKEREDTGHGL